MDKPPYYSLSFRDGYSAEYLEQDLSTRCHIQMTGEQIINLLEEEINDGYYYPDSCITIGKYIATGKEAYTAVSYLQDMLQIKKHVNGTNKDITYQELNNEFTAMRKKLKSKYRST